MVIVFALRSFYKTIYRKFEPTTNANKYKTEEESGLFYFRENVIKYGYIYIFSKNETVNL